MLDINNHNADGCELGFGVWVQEKVGCTLAVAIVIAVAMLPHVEKIIYT